MDQAPKLGEGGGEAGGVGLLERDVQLVPCTKDAGVSPAGRGFGTLDWSEMVAGSRTELDTVQRQPAPTSTPTSPAGASRQMADLMATCALVLEGPLEQRTRVAAVPLGIGAIPRPDGGAGVVQAEHHLQLRLSAQRPLLSPLP